MMRRMAPPLEIAPREVHGRLKAGETSHLIDVRERHEFALARIQGAALVPMREQGLERCTSMARGIDAWSPTVDPGVPRY